MRAVHIAGVAFVLAMAGCQTAKNTELTASDSELKPASTGEETTADSPDGVSFETTASVKPAAPSNTIAKYVAPQPGTVFTWRNNWANLPKFISYKVAGVQQVGSQEYVKFTSVQGFKSTTQAYYNTSDFSLKGYRDSKDRALVTYKPVEQRYKFPMTPGDKWLTQWKSLDHKTRKVTAGGGVVQAIRMETLELPAGTFRAMKVKMPVQKHAPKGLTHYAWFSPELGITVKEQIGGGALNWTQVLEKVERPNYSARF